MLIVLLGLAGFTGMALGGLYLAGDRSAVSTGANEAHAADAVIAAADGGHGDAVAMIARVGGIEAATESAPHDPTSDGVADSALVPGGSASGMADKPPVSDGAAAPSVADTGAGDEAFQEQSSPASERVLHITNVGDRIVVTEAIAGSRVLPVGEAPTAAAGDAYMAPAPVVEPVPALTQADAVTVAPVLTPAPVTQAPTSAGPSRPQPPADVDEDAGTPPRADYEDVYPGCPRVLPQGAGEEMANERLALYGCLYYAVCAMPTEDSPATCTWYLNQKI